MYVTRPLSEYRKNPNALSLPPDAPNSGYLVIQDEESGRDSCFGLCNDPTLKELPFPQNKVLTLRDVDQIGEYSRFSLNDTVFIPVLNRPLSYNRYYAIKLHGDHKGEAFTCSREEDMTTCCFFQCVNDVKPMPFDPRNVYQQFEITSHARRGYFYAKSVALDGFAPYFLRTESWSVITRTPKNYTLDEAPGLNAPLRARLPDINFPATHGTSKPVVVGRWYTPFMFVREGSLRDQVERSMFYQVTLEQKWERIFSSQNAIYPEGKLVNVDVTLDREIAYVAGKKAVWDEGNVVEGAIWFTSFSQAGGETNVGLSVELFQRMKWEQKRIKKKKKGMKWEQEIGGKEKQVRVERAEKFEGNGEWRKFGSYVLVESFIIKRMDGSVVMLYGFRHTQHIKCRWE